MTTKARRDHFARTLKPLPFLLRHKAAKFWVRGDKAEMFEFLRKLDNPDVKVESVLLSTGWQTTCRFKGQLVCVFHDTDFGR